MKSPIFEAVTEEHVQIKWEEQSHDCTASSWSASRTLAEEQGTHYGVVLEGETVISCNEGTFSLGSGFYFSVYGPLKLSGGCGMIASINGYHGCFSIGGPIEPLGRLKYIDGCSDSLLIAPPVFGDPCLNFLYIPPHLDQTPHTHPSCRIGLVLAGSGTCTTSSGINPLRRGVIFILPTDSLHSFHTNEDNLRIAVFHPDSDFGPSSESHPMLNRTIINGVSATALRQLAKI